MIRKIIHWGKNHILKISFFTKFIISKSHFSQNSHFQSLIFHEIHIFKHQIPYNFWTKSWVLPQCASMLERALLHRKRLQDIHCSTGSSRCEIHSRKLTTWYTHHLPKNNLVNQRLGATALLSFPSKEHKKRQFSNKSLIIILDCVYIIKYCHGRHFFKAQFRDPFSLWNVKCTWKYEGNLTWFYTHKSCNNYLLTLVRIRIYVIRL